MLKKSRFLILMLFASAGFSSSSSGHLAESAVIFGGAIHSTAVILSSYMAGLL